MPRPPRGQIRSAKPDASRRGAWRFFQGAAVGLIAGFWMAAVWLNPPAPPVQKTQAVRDERPARLARAEKSPAPPADGLAVEPKGEGAPPLARAAILIDDLGQDLEAAQDLLSMDAALTFAVLPHLPHSRRIAEAVHRRGREVLLHLPMEPEDPVAHDPGPGALTSGMSREELRAALGRALDAVPHIVGVNNHMGSRLTEVDWVMEVVLRALKERGLFWVDSLTSPRSQGYRMAKRLGIGAARRQFFLDNEATEEAVRESLEQFAEFAARKGKAIAIGHPHPATRSALRAMLPKLKARDIRIVPVSELLE